MTNGRLQLQQARKELLDLGLRNPLLNYRAFKARGLEIKGERPSSLHRLLVRQQKTMSFSAVAAPPPAGDALGQPASPDPDDLFLQTPYSDADLQKRLLATYYAARHSIEEQGVNILYLALGMLRWRDGVEDKVRRAPLLLIPVLLFRNSANDPFRLRYTGADIGDNLSLQMKMEVDYKITIPSIGDGDNLDVDRYFIAVSQAIARQPAWSVDITAVSLGFFSFSKFLIYRDLDPANRATPLWEHPVLGALLDDKGFPPPANRLSDDAPIDPQINLADSHQVVDADSSQTLAIVDVNQGQNLVIQGPPGTGKSQTIANLIAEAMGNGKTVLFVSEKMAALDVVKRRLDAVGLGDACVEIHSHNTTKRNFLAELKRTVLLGKPTDDGRFPQRTDLHIARDLLNAHSEAMNAPIGNDLPTPYHVYGRLLQLNARLAPHNPPALHVPAMSRWSDADFQAQLAQARRLQTLMGAMGRPDAHPFYGSRAANTAVAVPAALRRLCEDTLSDQQTILQSAQQLADLFETAVPATLFAVEQLTQIAQRLLNVPNLFDINLHDPAWLTHADAIIAGLKAAPVIARLRREFDPLLIPQAWAQDVFPLRRGLLAGRGWWRMLAHDYRVARRELDALCRNDVPDEWDRQVALVDGIMEAQSHQPAFDAAEPFLKTLFNGRYDGLQNTDWPRLLRVADWMTAVHAQIADGSAPPSVLTYAAGRWDRGEMTAVVEAIAPALPAYRDRLQNLLDYLALDERTAFGKTRYLLNATFEEQTAVLNRFHKEADRLPELVAYNEFAAGLSGYEWTAVVEVAESWEASGEALTLLFEHAWQTQLTEKAKRQSAVLTVPPAQLSDQVDAFRELDSAFLRQNRHKLATRHWEQLPRHAAAGGLMKTLQHEMDKKTQHLPIRLLMAEAGAAIQRIKPVFMMSPLSIAAFLPPDGVQFDLVIFDEASQVRPVDAFGAILRGKQTVVVGDSRQLPPTSFFEKISDPHPKLAPSPSQEEGWDEGANFQTAESILDLFCRQNAPQRMLRWHYRSRHHSLIAVSNRLFYNRRLITFPSPFVHKKQVGLVLRHLPATIYERGGGSANPLEAQAVAEAALAHAIERPQLTLGVAAFSSSQQEAIMDKLEYLRRENEAGEEFFNSHPHEPFFVKNLENVQGDERDVMLLSVGYGRAADGSMTMNFGPLNQRGGERRLNVLITRSRQRCEVFSNFTAADIDLRRTEARGVIALKQYLHYAATGAMAEDDPIAPQPGAPFEEAIARKLRDAGHKAARRIGDGHVMFDLAVVDAEDNGRYTLGIECDGAAYSAAKSARDRERIQPSVLRGLGWNGRRLWAKAWVEDAEKEWALLEAAIADEESVESGDWDEGFAVERGEMEDDFPLRRAPAYRRAAATVELKQSTIYDYSFGDRSKALIAPLAEIVRVESPIHATDAMRRLSYAAGYKSAMIYPSFAKRLIKTAVKEKLIVQRGDFLWSPTMKRAAVRDRSELPKVSRKFAFISPEEYEEAVLVTIRDAIRVEAAAVGQTLPRPVALLLGFKGISGQMKKQLLGLVEGMVKDGRLLENNGWLSLSETSRKDVERQLASWKERKAEITANPIAPPPSASIFPPYQRADLQIEHSKTMVEERSRLTAWLAEIVAIESPVHRTEALRRLKRIANHPYQYRLSKVADELIETAVKNGVIVKRGNFLWSPEMTTAPARDRTEALRVSRKYLYLCDEELETAVVLTMESKPEMKPEDVPLATIKNLGFDKLDTGVKNKILGIVGRMEGVELK